MTGRSSMKKEIVEQKKECSFKECECCRFETLTEKYWVDGVSNSPDEVYKWLCDFCAGTMAEAVDRYPNGRDPEIYKAIGYGVNLILSRIEGGKE